MIELIEHLWNAFRRKYCPARIYKYGRVGLVVHDDRTQAEKICDVVDNWLIQWRDREREARLKLFRPRWNSFYSFSMGCVVDSPGKIRDWERKGYAWATAREFDEVSTKAQKRIEQEQNDKIRKKVEHCAREIAQGRSYIKEQRERFEKARRGQQ